MGPLCPTGDPGARDLRRGRGNLTAPGADRGKDVLVEESPLLPSLAHARKDPTAQGDGRLGGRITFWESTQAPSTKGHASGEHPITLEATEEHGGKY